jgi:hypothetical protein
MTIDLKGPAPEKMKPGELYRVVRVKDKTYRLRGRHTARRRGETPHNNSRPTG